MLIVTVVSYWFDISKRPFNLLSLIFNRIYLHLLNYFVHRFVLIIIRFCILQDCTMKLDVFLQRTLNIKTWLELFPSMFYLDSTKISSLTIIIGKRLRILMLTLIDNIKFILFLVSHVLGHIFTVE